MIKEEAERLAREQKISVDQIIREEWEMKILQLFFDTTTGKKVLFKGGTALRLGYGSPRYSEDLDFSVINGKKITNSDMQDLGVCITSKYTEAKISDQQMKFNTALIEFKIRAILSESTS